jgi:D-alanyl-D-alanine dipeptidase
MTVTFKCNKTGNTVDFSSEYDIEAMRQHPEYTEVFSEEKQSFPIEEQPKRGRPKKVVEDIDTDSV